MGQPVMFTEYMVFLTVIPAFLKLIQRQELIQRLKPEILRMSLKPGVVLRQKVDPLKTGP